MNFIDKCMSAFGYHKKQTSSNVIFPTALGGGSSVIGEPNQQNYKAYLKQYADGPWVYACVSTISLQGSGIPLKLYKKIKKQGKWAYEEVIDHPILVLLDKVNSFMTGEDLSESTLAFRELSGNAYWLLDKFSRGKPTEIYPLRPDRVKIVPSKTEYISHYEYEVEPGKKLKLEKEVIVPFKYFNPQNDYYGLSPLSAARTAVETQYAGDIYNRNFFSNSAEPRGILTSDADMNVDQQNQAKHAWRAMHGGISNAHKSAILSQGLKWQPIGISQKDMDFVNSKKMTREDILCVFKVPPVMVGVLEHANYSNAKEQREIFWRDGMIPKLNKYIASLNEFFVKKWDASLEIAYDYSGIDALKEDTKLKAETDTIYTQAGIKTINEVREEMGMTPVPYGDTWNTTFGTGPIGSGSPAPTEPIEPKTIKEKPTKIDEKSTLQVIEPTKPTEPRVDNAKLEAYVLSTINEDFDFNPVVSKVKNEEIDKEKAIRDKFWHEFKDFEENEEKKWHEPLQKFFNSLEKEVENNLENVGWKEFGKIIRSTQKENQDQRINDIIFDSKNARKRAKKQAEKLTANTVKASGDRALQQLALDTVFNVENPAVQAYIEKKTFIFAKEVVKTTKDELRTTLKEALKAGEGIPEVKKRISTVFTHATGPRLEAIARTEVISASNAGAIEAYTQSDVVKEVQWISTRDANVREEHRIDGEKIKLGGTFSNGLSYPGDPTGDPGNIINCRCSVRGLV